MNASVFLNTDYIEDICLAVSKMHGSERRSFIAEMILKFPVHASDGDDRKIFPRIIRESYSICLSSIRSINHPFRNPPGNQFGHKIAPHDDIK
jgi:hypothetical protein